MSETKHPISLQDTDEYMYLSNPEREFHNVRWLVAKAKIWLNHPEEDQIISKITNGDVMEYVCKNLKLTPSVEKFRKWAMYYSSEHLQVAKSPDGHRSYILDENSVVLGDPKDTFFFFRVQECWGIVADVETNRRTIRVGYHMGGHPWGGETNCIRGLISGIREIGKVVNMEILYNGSQTTFKAVNEVVGTNDDIIIHTTDLREKNNSSSSHISITDNTIKLARKEKGIWAPVETQTLFHNKHIQKVAQKSE